MTDAEREAQIRHEIKARAPSVVTPDLLFMLRLLDEARAEISRLICCNTVLLEIDKNRCEELARARAEVMS